MFAGLRWLSANHWWNNQSFILFIFRPFLLLCYLRPPSYEFHGLTLPQHPYPGDPSWGPVTRPEAWCILHWFYWLHFLGVIPIVWRNRIKGRTFLKWFRSLLVIFFFLDQSYSRCSPLASFQVSPLSIAKFIYMLVGILAMICIEKNDRRDSPSAFILQMRTPKPSLPS